MTVHFYRFEPTVVRAARPSLPSHMRIRCWQPERDGFPQGSVQFSNYFWWALTRCSGFANPGFTEIRIEEDDRLLHRLIVTPAWYRFPFMSGRDLQIGHVWTKPAARRRSLARVAIAEAHHRFAGEHRCFWYVTEADNRASQALAESCGYRLVAAGQRTRRLGLALLGQYVIEQFV